MHLLRQKRQDHSSSNEPRLRFPDPENVLLLHRLIQRPEEVKVVKQGAAKRRAPRRDL